MNFSYVALVMIIYHQEINQRLLQKYEMDKIDMKGMII